MFPDFKDLALKAPDHNIQAYNQADYYLLNELAKRFQQQKIAIVNDHFGALALALREHHSLHYNDSAIFRSQLCQYMPLDELKLHPISELQNSSADIILLQLPKNLHFFCYQLALLSQNPYALVIVAGMQKHWPSSFYQAAYEYFEQVEVLPGIKKAKCMILQNGKQIQGFADKHEYSLAELGLELVNYPNVFSREKLDIGSRFLLENLPSLAADNTLLDLACGNGVLGIYAQKQHPQLFAHYIDESYCAIQSCLASLQRNEITSDRYQCHHNNSLENLSLNAVDTVLCNPPFHHGHRISESIAHEMIAQSHQCLRKGGQLLLVANRHLGYYAPLKKQFAQVNTVASNHKFTLYQAIKST